jgi:hypothetical protein
MILSHADALAALNKLTTGEVITLDNNPRQYLMVRKFYRRADTFEWHDGGSIFLRTAEELVPRLYKNRKLYNRWWKSLHPSLRP